MNATPGNGSDVVDGEGTIREGENEVLARIAKAKGETTQTEKSMKTTYMKLVEELKALEAQKNALSKEIEAAATPELKIKHPAKGVSIRAGMGLSDNKPRYDAIRVCPCVSFATRLKTHHRLASCERAHWGGRNKLGIAVGRDPTCQESEAVSSSKLECYE